MNITSEHIKGLSPSELASLTDKLIEAQKATADPVKALEEINTKREAVNVVSNRISEVTSTIEAELSKLRKSLEDRHSQKLGQFQKELELAQATLSTTEAKYKYVIVQKSVSRRSSVKANLDGTTILASAYMGEKFTFQLSNGKNGFIMLADVVSDNNARKINSGIVMQKFHSLGMIDIGKVQSWIWKIRTKWGLIKK